MTNQRGIVYAPTDMSDVRIADLFTPKQIEWFQFTLFVAIFPIAYWMYSHWQSMKRRFPAVVETAGQRGQAKVKSL